MRLIWATRGRYWGFRFLESGGFDDPLAEYESAFSDFEDDPEVFAKVGDRVVLRFADPLGRRDSAGRMIPHAFVVFPPDAARVSSLEEGIEIVWRRRQVQDRYRRIWDQAKPTFDNR